MSELVMNPGVYPDSSDLGPRLRGIDKLECRATHGVTPEDGIRQSIAASSRWWVGTVDGREEMVVGVGPMTECSGFGKPWMLSTDKIFHGRPLHQFLRRTPEFMALASAGYDVLFNIISAHNHASRRWLRFAGFSIKETPSHWCSGIEFQEFIYVVPGGRYDLDNL